jgi:hypothetical protein
MATHAAQSELVARWSKPGGIPFKGSLISGEGDAVCMCAQGQALHYVGGWDFDRLRNVEQVEADKVTAELLDISRAHAVLLRNTNDNKPGAPSIVLTNPELVIGDQAPTILAFWRYFDTMTAAQWDAAWVAARDAARDAAGVAARVAAWVAAGVAARDAAGVAARDAARDAAGVAARDAAGVAARDAAGVADWVAAGVADWDAARDAAGVAARDAAGFAAGATAEIMGAAILRERGKPFVFLPAFGFATPEAVLASVSA